MTHDIFPAWACPGKGKQSGQAIARLLLVLLVGLWLSATAGADIGQNSCLPTQSVACEGNMGDIKQNSCVGSGACWFNRGAVGNNACTGIVACLGNRGTIGNDSCTGRAACSGNRGTIGNNSCSGICACIGNIDTIGNDQRNTPQPCS